jgi:hypothetical protein
MDICTVGFSVVAALLNVQLIALALKKEAYYDLLIAALVSNS